MPWGFRIPRGDPLAEERIYALAHSEGGEFPLLLNIDKGGAGMTRTQISDAFDKLQAEVGFGASGQSLTVGITTVRQHLPAVVALVGALFALSFDTLSQAALFAVAGSGGGGGAWQAAGLGASFVLGMLVAPGLYWLVVGPTQPRIDANWGMVVIAGIVGSVIGLKLTH